MHKQTFFAQDFGPDFKWGVGMAAPQNEGAAFEDGKGLSVWDVFARKRNVIKGGARPLMPPIFTTVTKTIFYLLRHLALKCLGFLLLGVGYYHTA